MLGYHWNTPQLTLVNPPNRVEFKSLAWTTTLPPIVQYTVEKSHSPENYNIHSLNLLRYWACLKAILAKQQTTTLQIVWKQSLKTQRFSNVTLPEAKCELDKKGAFWGIIYALLSRAYQIRMIEFQMLYTSQGDPFMYFCKRQIKRSFPFFSVSGIEKCIGDFTSDPITFAQISETWFEKRPQG